MVNDFLKLKEKSKKVDEIRHDNVYRKYGQRGGASKDDYDYRTDDNSYDPELAKELAKARANTIDAEVISETKNPTETKKTNEKQPEDPLVVGGKATVGILNGIKVMSNESAKMFDKNKKEDKFYKKYPDIDDQELSKKLRRLQMEQQYSDLSGDTKVVKTGSEKAKDVLQTIGNVAGIATGIAGIALVIYQIRHGQKPPAAN